MSSIKRFNRGLIGLAMLALVFVLLPLSTVSAAGLSPAVTLSPTAKGAVAQHTISFTAVTEIPLDGKITVTGSDFTWPADGDKVDNVSVTDDGSSVTLASATVTQADTKIVIVLNNAGVIAANSAVVVKLDSAVGITNPATAGNSYTVSVATTTSLDAAIDSGNDATVSVSGDLYSFGITAGTASLTTTSPSSEIAVTLDGTKKTSTWTSVENTDDWDVVDARGTGAGWHITVAAGSMTDNRGSGVDSGVMTLKETNTNFTDNNQFTVQMAVAASTTDSGDNGVVHTTDNDGSSKASDIAGIGTTLVTGGGITVVTAAANEGLGAFTILPTVTVTVPAGAYATSNGSFALTITLVQD